MGDKTDWHTRLDRLAMTVILEALKERSGGFFKHLGAHSSVGRAADS
jgi:hypothetical protein